MLIYLALAAVCLTAPVDGPVVAGYSPSGAYAGHWGIDYAAPAGAVVGAPASGRVSFAGTVAGMMTVTIEPVGGFKVSASYLSSVEVTIGQRVTRGDRLGVAGMPHGRSGVHLSTRIEGRYVDPDGQMGCGATDISRALRLVTPPSPYPRRRADRNPGWNLRPNPHRPSTRRRSRLGAGRARSSVVHPGR